MPTKAELYAQMADKVATQLTGSWQEWAGFLTTASRLYKYPFHEQLMIYAQRPDATASLTGLTLHNTTKENLARAFVEGLLCSQRDCLELIRSLGAEINRILLIGGGAKSVAIRTLAPSILGMDVTRPATDEYVAIGAARQAAWVLSGETEPPAWPLTIDGVETGEPTEAVYEAYAKARG